MRFKAVYTDNNGTSYEWFTGYRRVHAELQQPPSQLWFCTVCGAVYARVEMKAIAVEVLSTNQNLL